MLNFKPILNLAVALSGGSDSLALTILIHEWAKENGKNFTAIIINHNLRKDSNLEIKYISQLCSSLNINYVVLDWEHDLLKSNIQHKARDARYKLLCDYCLSNDITTLATGHHKDDQIENFFIRLSRGSGLIGLSNSSESFLNNIRIIKPLRNISKNDCRNYLIKLGISWCEDQSNSNDIYLRNRFRKKIDEFMNLENISPDLFKERIINTQECFNDITNLFRDNVMNALFKNVKINNFGFAIIKWKSFLKTNSQVTYFILSYLLTIIGGNKTSPRLKSIKNLIDKLNKESNTTLHNCVINAINSEEVIIFKEIGKKNIKLKAKGHTLWDNRFHVKLRDDNQFYTINTLNFNEYHEIKGCLDLRLLDTLPNKIKQKVLFTLPVIKFLKKIIALPHLKYYNSYNDHFMEVIFKPKYTSKIIHY